MNDEERIIGAESSEEDETIELSLRPQLLAQYIGQDKVKSEMKIYIKAAKKRDEALDHVLLYGPPGLGKTTLAFVIANEMGVHLKSTSGPAIEKAGDLVALLSELNPGDVLFIDEIHRLAKPVEEVLYSAMEDFYIDIVVGEGQTTHAVHVPLPPFTLIGKYPVLAICYKEKTMRHLALSYGVEAIYMPELANGQQYYFAALRRLLKEGRLQPSDMVGYLSSGKAGTKTSFLEINVVEDALKHAEETVLPNNNRYL